MVLAIAQTVSEIGFSLALPFTPLYVQQLGVPDPVEAGLWAGVMAGCFSVAMGGMAPVWGIVADRFGHRLMIQRAFLGAGAAIAMMSLVQTPEQLLVLRITHGMLTGVVTAIATLVSLTAPAHRLGTVLGLMHSAFFLGISLGPLLGGIVADRFGLRTSFAITGLILAACGVLVTLFVREAPRERHRPAADAPPQSPQDRRWILRPSMLGLIGLMALTRFAQFAPQPILPLYVQSLVDSTDGLATTVGVVLAATGIASSVSALVVGRLIDRFGQRTVMLVCLAIAAILSPFHAVVSTVGQLVALRAAIGFTQGGTAPTIQALVIAATPTGRRGAAFGLLTTANSVGSGIGPVIGGTIAAAFGVVMTFVAMTPVFVATAWVLVRVRPGRRS